MMFESDMDDAGFAKIQISHGNLNLFHRLLDWIYSSEISFPDDEEDIFQLILLADEYLLEDLGRRCEDELLFRLDRKNAVMILLQAFKFNTIISDNLVECCINTIIEEFEDIARETPDFEKKLSGKKYITFRGAWTYHQNVYVCSSKEN